MNFAAELFLSAAALIFTIVIVSEIVARLIGTKEGDE